MSDVYDGKLFQRFQRQLGFGKYKQNLAFSLCTGIRFFSFLSFFLFFLYFVQGQESRQRGGGQRAGQAFGD
jgi:hypothetical protein